MMLTYHISHEKKFSTALSVPERSGVNDDNLFRTKQAVVSLYISNTTAILLMQLQVTHIHSYIFYNDLSTH